jgi:plasmid rolling circle replication initiator protein Rep
VNIKIIDNPSDVKSVNNSEINFQKRKEKYTEHKRATMQLSQTYLRTDLPMKEQIKEQLKMCGSMLLFAENPDSKDWELASALFCRKRLCPLCSWRRSVQIFHNVYEIITHPDFTKHNPVFIMGSLTAKNCSAAELPQELSRYLSAWRTLIANERQIFKKAFLGTFRSLEITYNSTKDTYHPHFHFLAAVEPEYFYKNNENYISQDRLINIWKDALNNAPLITSKKDARQIEKDSLSISKTLQRNIVVDKRVIKEKYPPINYEPNVDIRRVKKGTKKGIAETAKYTVKPSSYINRPEVVETLDISLRGRRTISYGGIFKDVHMKLNLEDEQVDEGFTQLKTEWFNNDIVRKIMLKWTLAGNYQVKEWNP